MIYQGSEKYPVKEVILHTSATPGNWHEGKTVHQMRDEIDQWHKQRGWRGIGYHFVVAPNGDVARGRFLSEIGAHVQGRNRGTIGICMIPSRTHDGVKTFDAYFTKAQRKTVLQLVSDLPGIERVTGHNDFAAKECPGFKVRSSDWLGAPIPPTPHGWLYRIAMAALDFIKRLWRK